MSIIRIAGLAVTVLAVASGAALSAELFVSGTGSGANCTRTAPCQLLTATTQATNGSKITCATSGNLGELVLTDTWFSIDCTAVDASVASISIFNADPSSYVSIQGLVVDGALASSCSGSCGVITFQGSGTLLLDRVTVRNRYGRNSASIGLNFAPNARALLTVMDSRFVNTGGGGAILIRPTGNALMSAVIHRTVMETGTVGVKVDATATNGGRIDVDVGGSVAAHFTNNGYLALANAGDAQVRLKLTQSRAADNSAYGAVASGAQAFMIVSESSLTHNATGLAQLDGSTVATYANNDVNFNTTNTAGTITTIARR